MKQVNYTNAANEFGYKHESNIKCSMNASEIEFEFDINEFEPSELVQAAVKHFQHEIEEWLGHNFGLDVFTGEGYKSIHDWFGMGSYALMELGLKFDFHYSDSLTTMTVSC